jgi:hypothetical protein
LRSLYVIAQSSSSASPSANKPRWIDARIVIDLAPCGSSLAVVASAWEIDRQGFGAHRYSLSAAAIAKNFAPTLVRRPESRKTHSQAM